MNDCCQLPIDRTNPEYWFDGAGAWMNRWHCTGSDSWLMVGTVLACLWMVSEYLIVAANARESAKISSGAVATYLVAKTKVFTWCAFIHVLNLIVAWYVTVYWVVFAMLVWNAYQARRMNASRLRIDADAEMIANENRRKGIANLLTIVGSPSATESPDKTLQQIADELRGMAR